METTKTHWKRTFNKDYLGAHDLDEGKDLVATIDHAEVREVKDTSGKASRCNVAVFKGSVKPMILNVTNCKKMQKFTGSKYLEDWKDVPITICVRVVNAFGEEVEALRIKDKQPSLEKAELTPDHQRWSDAVNYLKGPNATIDNILKQFKVSEENQAKLMEEAV